MLWSESVPWLLPVCLSDLPALHGAIIRNHITMRPNDSERAFKVLLIFIVWFIEHTSSIGNPNTLTKGQIKPKAVWRTVDSPKKRMNEFGCFFAFLLFYFFEFLKPFNVYLYKEKKVIHFLFWKVFAYLSSI